MGVDTNRQDLDGLPGCAIGQQSSQLDELLDAVGSPVASIEDEDDGLLATER